MPITLEVPEAVTRKRQQHTVFPDNPAGNAVNALIYNAYRHEWAGTRLTRWLMYASLAAALLWAATLTPRWMGFVIAAIFILLLISVIAWQRRRDFVGFEEQPLPAVTPTPMPASDKIAVYATGYFTVEGQYQRFTSVPGFARTFATGERALLCLVRERKFAGISSWPILETGMWYIFFMPSEVHQIRYGMLKFASRPTPAVAIDYTLTIPASSARREKVLEETVYLTCADEDDTPRLLADLLYRR